MSSQSKKIQPSRFPIPSSIHDLEREPYHLLPYPNDFEDDTNDEEIRINSFQKLVQFVEQGNKCLISTNSNSDAMNLFLPTPVDDTDRDVDDYVEEEEEPWMDQTRIQALYTLVRKSTSLPPDTREALATALSDAVSSLCKLLKSFASTSRANGGGFGSSSSTTVPQEFRDAFACHLYMLYTFMFFLESDTKGQTKVSDEIIEMRQTCADAMLMAAETAASCRSVLWKLGVPDEAVVVLPCRIAYPMLEAATGVVARKTACADQAIRMIAITTLATDSLLSTVTAALMDLMSSFEHMASIAVDVCDEISNYDSIVTSSDSSLTVGWTTNSNRLAVELLREIGRLDVTQESKSIGIKYVAPFLSELAESQPKLVLRNLSHILLHLQSEPYNLRSSIIIAISHVLEYLGMQQNEPNSSPGGDGTDESNSAAPLHDTTKTRTALLDILTERVYDVSSYTRAAALKAWIRLCQTQSIPKELISLVTRIAMDRLQDKTVVVRKQSMQLLTLLLENNPYQGNLNPEPFRAKLAELYEYIKAHMPAHIAEAQNSISDGEENNAEEMAEIERAALAAAIAEADSMMITTNDDDMADVEREYCAKVQALKFTKSALDFIDQFEDATQALEGMLLSANTSDVTEALRFFVKARHFGLPCAVTGMKRALALMWSTEANIRDEVLKAFVDVFVAVPGTDGKKYLGHDEIAKNLLVLISQASVSEVASIEEAIIRLVTEERLPDDLFLILWSFASKGSLDARACALQLISMGAGADRSIIDSKSRLKLLLDSGLGARYESTSSTDIASTTDMQPSLSDNHWKIGRAAAICLQRIERAQVDPTDAKYLVLERIIEELSTICQGSMCLDDDENDTLQWFSTAEHSIKALFVISPEPEIVCKKIIVQMSQTTFPDDINSIHSLRLARFFHVLGQIAISLLVYTEALSGSVRRGNAKLSLKKQEEADETNQTNRKSNKDGGNEEDAIEAELGVAAEVEAENERRLTDIAENEIVGRNLFAIFGPLLIRVVGNEGEKFNSEILAQASTLALCKFMCVSSSFCEKHLPLLFTALANAPSDDTTMRANTVIALGDLAFRFPNEVEPYTPRMYACLRDSSIKVRRHTLMVLTHLILNDMVKVKGQVCEIAICLRDEDSRIRDMSRLLFHELSKRSNNPIYNLLPEIISQLSIMSTSTEDFRSILTFLLGFIKKERQNETLTEKLCQRFPKCTTPDQAADLAYCITQLKLTEKSIKCLSDSFNLYKSALSDEQVYKSFASIVIKAKKFMKPERKQLIEEWEAKLSEFASIGIENQLADENAAKSKKRAAKSKKRAVSSRKVNNKRPELVDGDNELDFPGDIEKQDHIRNENNEQLVDSEDENITATSTHSKRKQKRPASTRKSTRKRPELIVDEDDELDFAGEIESDGQLVDSDDENFTAAPIRGEGKQKRTASTREVRHLRQVLKVDDDDELDLAEKINQQSDVGKESDGQLVDSDDENVTAAPIRGKGRQKRAASTRRISYNRLEFVDEDDDIDFSGSGDRQDEFGNESDAQLEDTDDEDTNFMPNQSKGNQKLQRSSRNQKGKVGSKQRDTGKKASHSSLSRNKENVEH